MNKFPWRNLWWWQVTQFRDWWGESWVQETIEIQWKVIKKRNYKNYAILLALLLFTAGIITKVIEKADWFELITLDKKNDDTQLQKAYFDQWLWSREVVSKGWKEWKNWISEFLGSIWRNEASLASNTHSHENYLQNLNKIIIDSTRYMTPERLFRTFDQWIDISWLETVKYQWLEFNNIDNITTFFTNILNNPDAFLWQSIDNIWFSEQVDDSKKIDIRYLLELSIQWKLADSYVNKNSISKNDTFVETASAETKAYTILAFLIQVLSKSTEDWKVISLGDIYSDVINVQFTTRNNTGNELEWVWVSDFWRALQLAAKINELSGWMLVRSIQSWKWGLSFPADQQSLWSLFTMYDWTFSPLALLMMRSWIASDQSNPSLWAVNKESTEIWKNSLWHMKWRVSFDISSNDWSQRLKFSDEAFDDQEFVLDRNNIEVFQEYLKNIQSSPKHNHIVLWIFYNHWIATDFDNDLIDIYQLFLDYVDEKNWIKTDWRYIFKSEIWEFLDAIVNDEIYLSFRKNINQRVQALVKDIWYDKITNISWRIRRDYFNMWFSNSVPKEINAQVVEDVIVTRILRNLNDSEVTLQNIAESADESLTHYFPWV
jgi:hypothetical protein